MKLAKNLRSSNVQYCWRWDCRQPREDTDPLSTAVLISINCIMELLFSQTGRRIAGDRCLIKKMNGVGMDAPGAQIRRAKMTKDYGYNDPALMLDRAQAEIKQLQAELEQAKKPHCCFEEPVTCECAKDALAEIARLNELCKDQLQMLDADYNVQALLSAKSEINRLKEELRIQTVQANQYNERIQQLKEALKEIMTYTKLGIGSVRRIRQIAGKALAAQPQKGE